MCKSSECFCIYFPRRCYFIFSVFSSYRRCRVRERAEGRVKPPQSLYVSVFNLRGCSTNEVKKGDIGKMLLVHFLGRVLTKRVGDGTECAIEESMKQVFVVRQVCENDPVKGKDVFWAEMDLERAY